MDDPKSQYPNLSNLFFPCSPIIFKNCLILDSNLSPSVYDPLAAC